MQLKKEMQENDQLRKELANLEATLQLTREAHEVTRSPSTINQDN